MQVLMYCRMRRWRKEIIALVDMRFQAARAATVAGATRMTVMMVATVATAASAGNHGRKRISRCGRRLNSRGRGCPRSW